MIKSKKLLKFREIEHFFFNRLGGKSNGIYKSLNCGLGSSDNKKNILKNLALVEKNIKSDLKKIFLLKQMHSNKFYYIDKTSKLNKKKFLGDALITNKSKTPIAVLTADCAAIVLFFLSNINIGAQSAVRTAIGVFDLFVTKASPVNFLWLSFDFLSM